MLVQTDGVVSILQVDMLDWWQEAHPPAADALAKTAEVQKKRSHRSRERGELLKISSLQVY